MRIPRAWRPALETGRLLVLSPFSASVRRPTADAARQRNERVAALARVVFVAHAEPGGETERVAELARTWGRPVLGFEEGKGVEDAAGEIRASLSAGRG